MECKNRKVRPEALSEASLTINLQAWGIASEYELSTYDDLTSSSPSEGAIAEFPKFRQEYC
jgi:hypothetical protein